MLAAAFRRESSLENQVQIETTEGPGSSTPCRFFDGSITLATEGSVQGRIWNSANSEESTFDWADLALPTLLVMSRKCAGIESLHQKCVSGGLLYSGVEFL